MFKFFIFVYSSFSTPTKNSRSNLIHHTLRLAKQSSRSRILAAQTRQLRNKRSPIDLPNEQIRKILQEFKLRLEIEPKELKGIKFQNINLDFLKEFKNQVHF